MYKRITAFSWLLTVLFLGYNLFYWGGLAVTPGLGDALSFKAPRENILIGLYLSAGRQTVVLGGMPDSARRFAAGRLGDQLPGLVAQPSIEGALLAQDWIGRAAFYGAPLLLVLSIVLSYFRPKPIRSLGG